jgi:hypothetical protein
VIEYTEKGKELFREDTDSIEGSIGQ